MNNTKIVVYLDISTTIDQKEVMIQFKSFISTSDLFIIVYERRFERWFIVGSSCGLAKYFLSEQYKNCRLIAGTTSVDQNGSNDRHPIMKNIRQFQVFV